MIINSFSYRVCYKFPPSLEFAMEVLNVYVFNLCIFLLFCLYLISFLEITSPL